MAITVAATTSGNEITDAVRTTGTLGDGRTPPDSSYGIWQTTTNLVSNGGFETTTTGWTLESSTISRATSQSKFGVAALQIVAANAQANEGASTTFAGAPGTLCAVSAWAKLISGAATVRVAISDSVSGKQGSAGVALTGTWQRISFTATTGAASNTFLVYVETSVQASGTYVIDGVQVEAKPYATPYVETNGSAAGRSTTGKVVVPGSLIDGTQAWVALRYRWGYTGDTTGAGAFPAFLSVGSNTTNEYLLMYRNGSQTYQFKRGPTPGRPGYSPAAHPIPGQKDTIIASWTATASNIWVDGAIGAGSGAQSITLVPSDVYIGLGAPGCNGAPIDGDILWYAIGVGTLAAGDITTINGWGDTDPTLAQLAALNGGAANPTFVWTANTATVNLPIPALLTLSAGETTAPTVGRGVGLARAAAAPSGGALARGVGATYRAAAASAATQGRGVARTLRGTAASAAAHRKGVASARTAVAPSLASRALSVGATYRASASSVTAIGRGIARALRGIAPSSPSRGTGIGLARAAAAPSSPSRGHGIALARTAVAPSVASRALGIGAAYAAVASSVATIGRGIARAFAALAGSVASALALRYGTVTITDAAVTAITLGDTAVTVIALADSSG